MECTSLRSIIIPFSVEKELEFGAFIKEKNIITKINLEEFTMPLSNLTLQGKHNVKKLDYNLQHRVWAVFNKFVNN